MKMICDNCGNSFSKTPSSVKKYKHSFCCRRCYFEFRKNSTEYKVSKKKDFTAFHKIKELSRRKLSNDEIKM